MKVKVAVVGFGFMGMTHIAQILRNENAELVALIVRDPSSVSRKLREGAGNFAIEGISEEILAAVPVYQSLAECLENREVDAVHLCVHTDLHVAMAREALERGLHVLVEKPFTLDVAQGEALIRLAAEKQRILMVAQVVRFMPAYRRLKEWLDAGTYGALQFLSLTRFTGEPAWGQWQEKKADGSSGGALFDLVIHDIDFAQYVLGLPEEVRSVNLPGALSPHDYVSATWTYANGVTTRIEGGNIFHTAFPFQAGFTARFEQASVQFTSMKPEVIRVATADRLEEIPVEDAGIGFYEEIARFYASIRSGKADSVCTPESALDTIRLCYRHVSG
jgi:predicted dehydrogenase